MGEMRRAIAREEQDREKERDRFASTLVSGPIKLWSHVGAAQTQPPCS